MYTKQLIKNVLEDVRNKKLTSKKAMSKLKNLPYESFPFAKIDHHRSLRKGFPEVIYAPNKTYTQIARILKSIKKAGQSPVITRLTHGMAIKLKREFPALHFHFDARIAYLGKLPKKKKNSRVAVLTGGTGDIAVAEEAALTLELMGCEAKRIYDCVSLNPLRSSYAPGTGTSILP